MTSRNRNESSSLCRTARRVSAFGDLCGKRETRGELTPYARNATTRTGCFRVSASNNPEPARKILSYQSTTLYWTVHPS